MSAVARVRIEVEVSVGSWNKSCTFAELEEQVGREGVTKLCSKLRDSDFKVIGNPKVSFVIVSED